VARVEHDERKDLAEPDGGKYQLVQVVKASRTMAERGRGHLFDSLVSFPVGTGSVPFAQGVCIRISGTRDQIPWNPWLTGVSDDVSTALKILLQTMTATPARPWASTSSLTDCLVLKVPMAVLKDLSPIPKLLPSLFCSQSLAHRARTCAETVSSDPAASVIACTAGKSTASPSPLPSIPARPSFTTPALFASASPPVRQVDNALPRRAHHAYSN
jgi:hypothetical protein